MRYIAFLIACLLSSPALSQSSGNFTNGPPPLSAQQLNSAFQRKADYPYAGPIGGVVITGPAAVGFVPIGTGATTAVWANPFTNSLTQALIGTATAQQLGKWEISADTLNASSQVYSTDALREHFFGGQQGGRTIGADYLVQTAIAAAGSPLYYVTDSALVQTNSGDGGTGTGLESSKGFYYARNDIAKCGGANIALCTVAEDDLMTAANYTGTTNIGRMIWNFESVQGTVLDAGLAFVSGPQVGANFGGGPWGPGVGFHNGIVFGEFAYSGLVPLDSGATILGTYFTSLSHIPVANGIDLSGFSFSGDAFKCGSVSGAYGTPVCTIDGNGNFTGAGIELLGKSALNSSILEQIYPANGLGKGIYVGHNLTGSQTPQAVLDEINVTADNAAVTGGIYGFGVNFSSGGSSLIGNRVAIEGSVSVSSISASAGSPYFIGGAFSATSSANLNGTNTSSGASGAIQGLITQTTASSGATDLLEVAATEFDILVASGATTRIKLGTSVVQNATDAVQGAVYDAAYMASSNAGAVGWKAIFQASDSNGQSPLASTGTLMNLQFANSTTIGNGIDLTNGGSNITITNYAFKSPNFSVAGNGNTIIDGSLVVNYTSVISSAPVTLHATTNQDVVLFASVNSGPALTSVNDAGNAYEPFTINGSTTYIQNAGVNAITISGSQAATFSGTVGLTPATWTDTQTCTAGQISVDASYIYACTATNTVKRAALSTF
jgi:hypothetical protein